jgi:hypothetical protein
MADRSGIAGGLPAPHRQLLRMLADTTVVLVLLTLGYFVFPLRLEEGEPIGLLRLGVSLALFGAVGWLLVIHSRRSRDRQSPDFHRIQQLLSSLYLLVLTFGLAYALIGSWSPDQIDGVSNRADALYFSVTVISTVGFGDIHATGSFARMLVTVQMLFNLI